MKVSNFTLPLYGVDKHNAIFFSLTKIWSFRIQPKKILPTFDKINETVRNSANSFKVTFSVCCHPEILLLPQRDITTSPLLGEGKSFCPHEIFS